MMALEKNNKDETEEISQNSEALKTEEILSLLSKTKQDFIKDLEFSNNISNLFKKKTLIDLANTQPKPDEKINKEKKLEKSDNTDKKVDETQENPEKKIDEKKYTEAEAKKIANDLAQEYYNRGYNVGVKKIKEELEKGDKALALSLKNLTDNIFSLTPELSSRIKNAFNDKISSILKEILGYEIDKSTNLFLKKIEEITEIFEETTSKIKVFLGKEDHEALKNYISENKLNLKFSIDLDDSLERGDIKIKCGSIEIEEIVSKKIKFSSNNNIDEELGKLDKNTHDDQQANNVEDGKMNTKQTITKPVIEKNNDPSQSNT